VKQIADVQEANSPASAKFQQRSRTESAWRSLPLLFAFLCLFIGTIPMQAQWTQVWGDDFTGTANTTYDHNNWWNKVVTNTGQNPWGDGTVMSTSDSLQNVYLDGNGHLVIAMTYDPNASGSYKYKGYASARLTARTSFGPFGKIETSIQNPSAQGLGAAFWSLGADQYPAATSPASSNPSTTGGTPWPYCGELDMMEIQAKTAGHNGSTIHGSDFGTDVYVSATVDLTAPSTFDNGFHTFTTEWAPWHYFFYLDGAVQPYGDIDIADTSFSDTWELEQPINVLLTSGVGANGGTPGTTGFPSNMVIDYVHYSQLTAGAPAPATSLSATAAYSNAVNLVWSASSTSGVTYDIYASSTPGFTPSVSNLVAQNLTGTSFQHTALLPNTTYYYVVMAANLGGESAAATATVTTQVAGNSTGMQLSAGGWSTGTYMNSTFAVGGTMNAHLHVPVDTSLVTNPAPQQVYDTERWGAAAWTIKGLNPGGGYNVRLHFVENVKSDVGQREFNVSINSQQVLTNFDIYQQAGGPNKAIAEQFFTNANADGNIEIETYAGAVNDPTISGIEIIPASGSSPVGALPGTTTALAIDSGASAAVQNFAADEEFNGGSVGNVSTATISTSGVTNPAPQAVYTTTRTTPFTYVLTGLEANATYDLRLHFAETYFTSAGSRIFNVDVNGTRFLSSFDIYANAGSDQALVEELPVNADSYGQIIVQLQRGSANSPTINGVEANLLAAAVGAPSQLMATPGSNVVNLAWTASSTPGVQYTIYRSTAGNGEASVATVSGTAYSDTSAINGTAYSYYVIAKQGSGFSPKSNWATATPLAASCSVPTIPGAPSGTATSSSQINLTWTASTASCTPTYILYRSTTSGFTASSGNQIATPSTNSYTDTGLASATTYFYLAKATNSGGTSSASQQGSAMTLGGGTGVYVDAGGGAVSGTPNSYISDAGLYSSGSVKSTTHAITVPAGITAPPPQGVLQVGRSGTSMTYTIGGFAANSAHSVRLDFAETYVSSAGQRVFNVAVNTSSNVVISNFDIIAVAGGKYIATTQTLAATANSSGNITIYFTTVTDSALISAIEIQ
jgi:fibronectin type 3 domain-containing protein